MQGLTDEQARQRTTASELTLGGLVKHVAAQERGWVRFILEGPEAMRHRRPTTPGSRSGPTSSCCCPRRPWTASSPSTRRSRQRTDELVRTLPDLDASHPLPEAPWFRPGATRSARRVFLHIVAETAQHSGHADILRESLDGQKTMG